MVISKGTALASTAVDAMKEGAFDYITKPVELKELDINPFIVGPEGSDAWVADARMTVEMKKDG